MACAIKYHKDQILLGRKKLSQISSALYRKDLIKKNYQLPSYKVEHSAWSGPILSFNLYCELICARAIFAGSHLTAHIILVECIKWLTAPARSIAKFQNDFAYSVAWASSIYCIKIIQIYFDQREPFKNIIYIKQKTIWLFLYLLPIYIIFIQPLWKTIL